MNNTQVDPDELTRVTLYLRRPERPSAVTPGAAGPRLRRTDLNPAPTDVQAVRAFAAGSGLAVIEDPGPGSRYAMVLQGTVARVGAAFGVSAPARSSDGRLTYRRIGPRRIPEGLRGVVDTVTGLEQHPRPVRHEVSGADGATDDAIAYMTAQIMAAYRFPRFTGRGQTIALVECAGSVAQADLEGFFPSIGLPVPAVRLVRVQGASSVAGGSADREVILDIAVAGAAAPNAKLILYQAPDTLDGIIAGLSAAIHDEVNRPHIVSLSWSYAEEGWPAHLIRQAQAVLAEAAALGVTVVVSSGDWGSSNGLADGRSVNFPGSSHLALAVGGTTLTLAADGQIDSEVVWNKGERHASGGGFSSLFPAPGYQRAALAGLGPARFGRAVPDVAAPGDRQYPIFVHGAWTVSGGTSAGAPLWAALIALVNEALGKPVGHVNPWLYDAGPGAFRDIVDGDNGAYRARRGFDACTGLGSPIGTVLLERLHALIGDGVPT